MDRAAYMRQYMNNRYRDRKAAALAELGGRCARCGSQDDLEFDHVDPKSKLDRIGQIVTYSDERLRTELAKCQLLCAKCHREKTAQDTGRLLARNTHGTLSAYRYCGPPKCPACKAAKRIANQRNHITRRKLIG